VRVPLVRGRGRGLRLFANYLRSRSTRPCWVFGACAVIDRRDLRIRTLSDHRGLAGGSARPHEGCSRYLMGPRPPGLRRSPRSVCSAPDGFSAWCRGWCASSTTAVPSPCAVSRVRPDGPAALGPRRRLHSGRGISPVGPNRWRPLEPRSPLPNWRGAGPVHGGVHRQRWMRRIFQLCSRPRSV
jgi:hypothetical protein